MNRPRTTAVIIEGGVTRDAWIVIDGKTGERLDNQPPGREWKSRKHARAALEKIKPNRPGAMLADLFGWLDRVDAGVYESKPQATATVLEAAGDSPTVAAAREVWKAHTTLRDVPRPFARANPNIKRLQADAIRATEMLGYALDDLGESVKPRAVVTVLEGSRPKTYDELAAMPLAALQGIWRAIERQTGIDLPARSKRDKDALIDEILSVQDEGMLEAQSRVVYEFPRRGDLKAFLRTMRSLRLDRGLVPSGIPGGDGGMVVMDQAVADTSTVQGLLASAGATVR